VLSVKDNQKGLAETVDDFFVTGEKLGWRGVAIQREKTVEKDHGRIETRRSLRVTDLSWMDPAQREAWKNLGALGLIETTQETGEKVSVEQRYFIASSGIKTVGEFARAVRAHWGVESMHWTLDVTFREDACRVRKDHAARNLAAVRKIVLALFQQDTLFTDRSLRRRRVLASRKPAYREELLGLRPRTSKTSESKRKKSVK
jgi:predicted transposase YbfD/YdcC